MKKALLLSVVASSMIMAGGDIAPVEPAVEVPAEVASWEFSGSAVAFYQTRDFQGNGDLFGSDESVAAAAVSLRAMNKDLIGGIGAGVEVTGISDVFLYPDVVTGLAQSAGNSFAPDDADWLRSAGAVTQAYLTYAAGNTSFKVGRQHLPKGLSPMAFTEGWQPVKNSFDAALVVNTDIENTVLVGAYVARANRSVGDLNDFTNLDTVGGVADADDGAFMITAQNSGIEGVTLTGTFYHLSEMIGSDDVQALWADAKFGAAGMKIALQGGTVLTDTTGVDDTTAFGAKVSGKLGGINASVAYSSVDDGTAPIENLGTNIKTPLYTQAILNQNTIKKDSSTVKVSASTAALGGTVGGSYIYSDLGDAAMASTFGQGNGGEGTYTELDLTYKKKVAEGLTVWAGYVYQNDDRQADEDQNFVRVWARYNF